MQSEDDCLEIGRVLKTWGLRGHVKVFSYAESPDTFRRVPEVYVERDGNRIPLKVEEVREQKHALLLRFEGRGRIEEVQDLVGATLLMHRRDLPPLEEGEYYWFELLGLQVETEEGKHVGVLREILETGSNDVYVVRDGDREVLVPAIRDVIVQVDLPGNRMIIRPLDGLLEDDDR